MYSEFVNFLVVIILLRHRGKVLTFRLSQHYWMHLLGALHSDVEHVALLRILDVLLKLAVLHFAANGEDLFAELVALCRRSHVGHLDMSVHVAPIYKYFVANETSVLDEVLLGLQHCFFLFLKLHAQNMLERGQIHGGLGLLEGLRHKREVVHVTAELFLYVFFLSQEVAFI